MTTLGLIGSGRIGGTVARLAVAAGYDVVLSNSRGPDSLADLVAELGPRARAGTVEEAAASDLVLVSIPVHAVPSLPADALRGKVVMDTNNYYAQRDGQLPGLADDTITVNEYLVQHVPGALVVKVFNNIYAAYLLSLARPAGAADRSALAIAGDDGDAKQAVTEFLDAIGYDAVDAGPLAAGGRRFQVGTAAYGLPYGTEREQTAPVAAVREALNG